MVQDPPLSDQSPNLKFLFLNIQGLTNKSIILDTFLHKQNINVICLTEHWLTVDEIPTALPDGYLCTSAFCRKDRIRGGSLILVRSDQHVRVCDVSMFCSELNLEGAAVFLDSLKTIVVSIYHSPSGDPNVFLYSFNGLLGFLAQFSNYTSIIGGDFNSNFDVTTNKSFSKKFCNVMRQYNFHYLNMLPTRGSNCLDNVLTNHQRYDKLICNIFNFPFSDHNGLMISMYLKDLIRQRDNQTLANISYIKFILPKKSINLLNDRLGSYDWENVLGSVNFTARSVCTRIFQILINNIHYFTKSVKVKSNDRKHLNNWYNSELFSLKNRLIFLDKLIKSSTKNSQQLKQTFANLKNHYRNSIKEAKLKYNTNMIENSSNKCRTAWRVIKGSGGLCTEDKPNHRISPDSFNDYFITSIEGIKHKIGTTSGRSKQLITQKSQTELLSWKLITPQDMVKVAKRLKNSDSNDVYLMSNNLLKKIVFNLAGPLAYCFNQCLLEGVFPDELKMSRICPIFKRGPKDKPDSYRPISVIPVISKLFELLVFDQISTFFERNNLLSVVQFGFRKGKSTTDAIDKLVHDVYSAFENKALAQATLCDLSKAFDCVNHSDLLMKLNHYGVCGLQLEFFRSYLNNRKQKVMVNGAWSREAEVKYGVPQGSVLGPLLFLICINDLPDFMNCKTYLYADDTTFVNISEKINELAVLAHGALNIASDWFKTNGFLLNEDKTKHIIFTLKPIDNISGPENYVNQVHFLGVHLDKTLTWGPHIDYIGSKLSRVIFLMKKLTNCIEHNYVRTAYFSFFQSIFRYGLIFYGNCNRIYEILILQKKVIRIMSGASFMDHCKPLFLQLKIQTIINLYIFDLVVYTLKNPSIINNVAHRYGTRTRTRGHTQIDFCRLSKTSNSHIVVSLKIYNKICYLINSLQENEFCNKFYKWLLVNPFYSLDEFLKISKVTFDDDKV